MYNLVVVPREGSCPRCRRETERYIQFHYGAQTLRKYKVGERLQWGDEDEGEPGLAKVAVLGEGIGCPNCGYDDDRQFRIDIENDVIVSVRPDDGELDYLSQGHFYWLVLEE